MFIASEHIVDYMEAYGVMITTVIALYWTLVISDTVNPLVFILYILPAGLVTVFALWALIISVWLFELSVGMIKKFMSSSSPV